MFLSCPFDCEQHHVHPDEGRQKRTTPRRHGDPNGDPIPIFDLTEVLLQKKKLQNQKTPDFSQNKWQHHQP